MANILMIYGTMEGQTRKIVEFMAQLIRETGHEVEIADVEAVPAGWLSPAPDAVLLAASIHVGRHTEAVGRFVQEQRSRLEAVPSAFLSVSLSAGGDEARRAEAEGYVSTFLQETGWQPTVSGTIGGALRYSKYGFFKRMLMKQIARRGGLPTDTSRDHEFTHWNELRRFTAQFLQRVEEAQVASSQP